MQHVASRATSVADASLFLSISLESTFPAGYIAPMPKVRWKHLGPCQHVVQFYKSDEALIDTLEEFLGAGLQEGESVVAIATGAHLDSLEQRLRLAGIDLAKARASDRYIPLDAEKLFDLFMHGGTF